MVHYIRGRKREAKEGSEVRRGEREKEEGREGQRRR